MLGLGGLFAVTYGAAIAGSEWSWGTLKVAVARGEARTRYVLGTFAGIAVVVTVGMLVTFAVGVGAGALAASIAGVPLDGIDDTETLGRLPEQFARGAVAVVAQGADDRIALDLAVWRDVGRVEQLVVTKAAQRTPLLVGADHALPKRDLVEATAEGRRDVGASWLGLVLTCGMGAGRAGQDGMEVVDLYREEGRRRIVGDDEHWVSGRVHSSRDGVEVDERDSLAHRTPQPDVVAMMRIGAAIGVSKNVSMAVEAVGVGTGDDRRHRDRQLARGRFPDPCCPMSGIRRPPMANASSCVRGRASPSSARRSVSQSNADRRILRSARPIIGGSSCPVTPDGLSRGGVAPDGAASQNARDRVAEHGRQPDPRVEVRAALGIGRANRVPNQ